jgi:hypothetical protein
MKKLLLVFLLIAHFLKELFWLAVIPLWHFPDEEQHFAHVAFLVEKQSSFAGIKFDVSQEIDKSSELLGTKRDTRGINKFTYHPEYRIPYVKGQVGIYEEEIKSLNTAENRQTMIKREAARYGPIYYFLAAIPYKIFYEQNLFVRVFASRLVSIILSTFTVFVVYLIAGEVFKKELAKITLAFLVSFQPMFSFVSAGINSDNLFNLIFALILYSCLKIFFQEKFRLKYVIILILSLILGYKTKSQIFIGFPIIFSAFSLSFLKKKNRPKKDYLCLAGLTVIILLILIKGKIHIPEYNPQAPSKLAESFFQYIFWHLRHTIAETIPWYWGVFNWLGVTLPRWVNQIQARILIMAAFGILIFFFRQIKEKKLFNNDKLKIIFLFSAAAIYYFFVISWDYFFRKTSGFSFGIQGRYFFPTIVSHMLFIFLGLVSLVPQKFEKILVKGLNFWWFVFSFIGLKTAVSAYYQFWPLDVFLSQASQYKPEIFKAPGLSLSFILFSLSSLIFILKLLRSHERKNN